jgi:potassium channel subfamily K
MGDTVIKAVKDVIIWLGEITVLPSDEDTLGNRLKYGVYRATLGQLDLRKAARDIEESPGDSDDESGYHELHPGLARIFRNGRHKHKQPEKDSKAEDRLAADLEETEKKDEDAAGNKGEKWEHDEHHYRRVLISQLRRVYADTQAALPKKYTYDEWQYFLKLLGENEEDVRYHRKAPTHGQEEREARQVEENNNQQGGQSGADEKRRGDMGRQGGAYTGERGGDDEDVQVTKWSWVGAQSPLMGDKEEAEWLLERFFQRLEESLIAEAKTKQTERGKEYTSNLNESNHGDASNNSERSISES